MTKEVKAGAYILDEAFAKEMQKEVNWPDAFAIYTAVDGSTYSIKKAVLPKVQQSPQWSSWCKEMSTPAGQKQLRELLEHLTGDTLLEDEHIDIMARPRAQ